MQTIKIMTLIVTAFSLFLVTPSHAESCAEMTKKVGVQKSVMQHGCNPLAPPTEAVGTASVHESTDLGNIVWSGGLKLGKNEIIQIDDQGITVKVTSQIHWANHCEAQLNGSPRSILSHFNTESGECQLRISQAADGKYTLVAME